MSPRAPHPPPPTRRRRRAGRGRARRALPAAGPARLSGAAAGPRPQPARADRARPHPARPAAGPGGRRRVGDPGPVGSGGRDGDPGYAFVRLQVVRTALEAGLPLRRRAWPKRSQLPPLLPQVWGLRLFPRSGGADELALDQRLSALSGAGPGRVRPARSGEAARRATCAACWRPPASTDPAAALREADERRRREYALLDSPEFDPCSLQARPTDLMRRRQHLKAALAAAAAVAVCGALLGAAGRRLGPGRRRRPRVRAEPGRRGRPGPGPAGAGRPRRLGDLRAHRLLRLARARRPHRRHAPCCAAPSPSGPGPARRVQVSATPGTPSGGPAGPPQLLYAGDVDQARVVILYDGLRIARYAEPKDGTSGRGPRLRAGRRRDRRRGERGGPGPGRRQRPLSDGALGDARPPSGTC